MEEKAHVGIVGSGFISKGIVLALEKRAKVETAAVLTRSEINTRRDFPHSELLTNSIEELIDSSDIIIECSGDPVYGTDILEEVIRSSLPVLTMDAELQVTTGSYFAKKGYISEAEGDQPGSLAAFNQDMVNMGFKPLVYGNIKGYLNFCPTRQDMEFWAKKQGISLDKVTSFTDGTKVQIEQTLVANGLGGGILKSGLSGIPVDDVETGGKLLAKQAKKAGYPVSDFILSPGSPAGVFITAEHDMRFRDILRYYKLGEGPYYTLLRPFHLCNLEIYKSLLRLLRGEPALLNNGISPSISVASVAKRTLRPGDSIPNGIGSFDVRGIAVRMGEFPDHVPIGLLRNARVIHGINQGDFISYDNVELPESLALDCWRDVIRMRG